MNIKQLDTVSVAINQKPELVWRFIADVDNWKQFSDFSKDMEQIGDSEWVTHTVQGDIGVRLFFDADKFILDQVVNLPNGDEQLIPYRILPKGDSCELMMTNQQTKNVSNAEYAEQMGWIREELTTIKRILEAAS